jgi:hypothetical protein
MKIRPPPSSDNSGKRTSFRGGCRKWIAVAEQFLRAHGFRCLLSGALAISSAAVYAQSAVVHQQREAVAKSEKIMAEALRKPGLLAQYLYMRDAYASSTDASFRVIFNQYISWFQTWVGEYAGARSNFSIAQAAEKDDAASPLLDYDMKAEPAAAAIAEMAKGRQAVFFNENHSYPLTRVLTVQMLAALRAEGFDTFAAETLYDTDIESLQKRGYPTADTGFYTEEPIYAEMVREALRLGFRVVAYEALSNAISDAREAEQARNLQRDVFRKHPQARLVVNAGYAHIQESGKYLGGSAMAQHFRRITGIDPLTVEQTMLVPHDKVSSDHPYYTAVQQALQPTQAIVFRNSKGEAWSLKQTAYDVSVFLPQDALIRGRPNWMDLGGLRKAYQISGSICAGEFPCLIEARYATEGDDAIPADRVIMEWRTGLLMSRDRVRSSSDGDPIADLYLRPGKYKVSARDSSNRLLQRSNITVR